MIIYSIQYTIKKQKISINKKIERQRRKTMRSKLIIGFIKLYINKKMIGNKEKKTMKNRQIISFIIKYKQKSERRNEGKQ